MTAAFETARLVAEPLSRAHADVLAGLHADECVMATMGGSTATRAESDEWTERQLRHWEERGFGIFVFRERGSDRFVGRGAIRRIELGGREEVPPRSSTL